MNTLETMLSRSTCRSYTDEQITEDELEKILIAANAAPVGMGAFDKMALSIIQDKSLLSEMEFAVKAALPQMANDHPIYNAPTAIIVSVKENDGQFSSTHPLSASCIMENMLLEATELGLASSYLMAVPMVMSKIPELCAKAEIPEGFVPIAIAALGHSETPVILKEETTNKISVRRV